jgi:hypothetical protein
MKNLINFFFSFDKLGNLYSLRINPRYSNVKVKSFNKTGICYKENNHIFNDISNVTNKIDADLNYIENNIFSYENSFLNRVIDKINRKEKISSLTAEKLIRVLLSLKGRNLFFKRQLQDSNILKPFFENGKEKLKRTIERNKKLDQEQGEFLLEIFKNEMDKKLSDKEFLSDLYNDQLLDSELKNNKEMERLIKRICKSKFYIYCTSESTPFITSDNPGFTIHEDGKTENMFFGSAKIFVFPLSKTRLLVVYSEDKDENRMIFKKLYYEEVSNDMLKLVYESTIENCTEKVFSNSKQTLDKILKEILKA